MYIEQENKPLFPGRTVISADLTLKNKTDLYEYKYVANNIYIDIDDTPVFAGSMWGLSAGCGLVLNSDAKISWFGGINYERYFNLPKQDKLLNISEIKLNVGIIF